MKVVSASCKWSLIVIVLSGFHPHNPVTFAHRYLRTRPPPLPPIRVYGVNNKSCVTSQITQTAYHLFIVVYHNNSSLRTKATASQTRAFVNELGRLPDLKINWECCRFLSPSCDSCFPTREKIEIDLLAKSRKFVHSHLFLLNFIVFLTGSLWQKRQIGWKCNFKKVSMWNTNVSVTQLCDSNHT